MKVADEEPLNNYNLAPSAPREQRMRLKATRVEWYQAKAGSDARVAYALKMKLWGRNPTSKFRGGEGFSIKWVFGGLLVNGFSVGFLLG